MTASPNVVEVTDQNFQQSVLEESRNRPVVVDFWAAWCAPCRMIGPVLERLADEYGGRFVLGKLDVDSNPQASSAFRIQSIPAVKAFVGGRVSREFVGAIPEPSIREFVDSILPSDADQLATQAEEAERAGRKEDAERLFRQALGGDSNHRRAVLGLARVLAERDETKEARELLLPLRPDPEAERLLTAIEVSEWASVSPNGEGPLATAEKAASEGRWAEALEIFMAAVQNGTAEDRERAHEAMLKLFAILGEDDPLVTEYRRRLAAALF